MDYDLLVEKVKRIIEIEDTFSNRANQEYKSLAVKVIEEAEEEPLLIEYHSLLKDLLIISGGDIIEICRRLRTDVLITLTNDVLVTPRSREHKEKKNYLLEQLRTKCSDSSYQQLEAIVNIVFENSS